MRFRVAVRVLIAVVSMTTAIASAQTKALTLDQARQFALDRNLSVAQAQNNIESAQAGVLAATGNYLPNLSASGSWNRSQNDRPGTEPFIFNGILIPGSTGRTVNNNFSAGVDLSYTIFNGFAREGNYTSASAAAISSENAAVRTRQSIVYQVEASYLNVLRNEQLVKVTEENLKRDQRQLERITESNRVGALSRADVYRQQSQVASDELSVITAQNNFDKAKADLLALIGLNVNEEYQIADPSITTEIAQSDLEAASVQAQSFSQLAGKAVTTRPDFVSAQEAVRSAEAGITSARAGYFPSVSAFAGYGYSSTQLSKISDNRSMNWGMNIRWTLFDGFGTNYAIQSAQVRQKNAELSLQQTERDINVEVKKALLDLEAARKAYDVSLKGVTSATEDRKIAEERYNLGAGTLLDLLIANAGLVNAQANKVNAVYNYIIAKRNVEFAVGERTY
ncbi:MAG: TolC family protein [Ignavibacteriae bacterium]|nr:TolC family protein [Ignavibacteriota bacterium]